MLAALLPAAARAPRPIRLTAGMVIDRSVSVRPGVYRLSASADLERPAIVIRGQDIVVDFNGAVLAGGPDGDDPDGYAGVGILVDGGSRVTIKNARVRGYKVAVVARRSSNLHLTGNDFSFNWKQRLYSGVEKESLVDWMSYHQNEKDEWLRYGAGVYLSDCDGAEIDHSTIVQGQNGVMAVRSKRLKVWNNTIQFLSAIGVGLYRTTDSTIMHNRIDWCVRGYSHGFYNRGQDSAGLLMYEQSSRNVVAYNSITHGGDGLFLWAGQSTMDTGQGGSNENGFFGNDFSHAVTNGIEATFSKNWFVGNLVRDCWHGVWGGYSYGSLWRGNTFSNNTDGIAIEHGLENVIEDNRFEGDETAIRLWQNATQDPNWGYPKHRDTRSRDYSIRRNTFVGNKTALDIRATENVDDRDNIYERVGTRAAGGFVSDAKDVPVSTASESHDLPAKLPGGMHALLTSGDRQGREFIIVDEWGPYDWKSPKLWPASAVDDKELTLRVLGPAGRWNLVSARGAAVSTQAGSVPGTLVVTPAPGPLVDYDVVLEYQGGEVVSPRGVRVPAGKPYRFAYSRFFVPIDWNVRFFEYTATSDPNTRPQEFAALIEGTPLKTARTDRLDYISGRAIEDGVPRDRFALVADATVDLPPGDYSLQLISDDGARVWMDGEEILDAWTPHESRIDRVAISGGRRRLKVVYYDVDGFAELRFAVQRK
jgi:parallel beta-helix repeat protein